MKKITNRILTLRKLSHFLPKTFDDKIWLDKYKQVCLAQHEMQIFILNFIATKGNGKDILRKVYFCVSVSFAVMRRYSVCVFLMQIHLCFAFLILSSFYTCNCVCILIIYLFVFLSNYCVVIFPVVKSPRLIEQQSRFQGRLTISKIKTKNMFKVGFITVH
jgi:hypothetical protein